MAADIDASSSDGAADPAQPQEPSRTATRLSRHSGHSIGEVAASSGMPMRVKCMTLTGYQLTLLAQVAGSSPSHSLSSLWPISQSLVVFINPSKLVVRSCS